MNQVVVSAAILLIPLGMIALVWVFAAGGLKMLLGVVVCAGLAALVGALFGWSVGVLIRAVQHAALPPVQSPFTYIGALVGAVLGAILFFRS